MEVALTVMVGLAAAIMMNVTTAAVLVRVVIMITICSARIAFP